jgi:hypothetical protein
MRWKKVSGNGKTLCTPICVECGKDIICNSHASLYCDECRKKIQKEKTAERVRRYRARQLKENFI